jgi:hypothetical protein
MEDMPVNISITRIEGKVKTVFSICLKISMQVRVVGGKASLQASTDMYTNDDVSLAFGMT